ncbi:hypothetical protein [Pseudomarimonas arenosa]|uniref:Uncharacterized protein n=1 Tax=Pseudomarimonas arenosa TaxID=2774145 RepID=A0AAW3ZP13_9GAMM|nr:hypothetical protein [Pseudomarimonas arenosa]MBD8526660.1 hypothetical protein [Pseudomarimonas arenosa]
MQRWILWCSFTLAAPALAVEPFIAAAVPSGSIDVQLCPTEAVSAGVPHLVTFGLPLPRGSLAAAGLSSVRVLRQGSEIAAFVDQLTPWRHRSDPAIDGQSVRVARIQLEYSFAGTECELVQVSWGSTSRLLNRPSLTAPRTAWHRANTGSFANADGVDEPDVYAVLPKQWLAKGVLKGVQHLPFDDSVSATRDNPASTDAIEHWPDLQELDHAQKNNFYSLINEDDPAVSPANRCPYKTEFEPWLYDRAASMYVLYFRSGSFKALREALRASEFYANHINGSGYFSLRDGDSKYVYPENLAYTAWLSGDTTQLAHLPAMLSAHDGFSHVWQNNPDRFWTERHTAFKLLANTVAWELNGGSTQRDRVSSHIAELIRHQNGADGAIPQPNGFIDGGLYHLGSQHDYDWDETSYGASSWMSVLLIDAVLRAYASAEDAGTAQLIRRMGNFLRTATVDTTEHSYDSYNDALALPRYGMLSDGSDGQVNYEDVEHALDVAAGLAWAGYFADLSGQPDPQLRQRARDLYFSYDTGVNFWIRPGGPSAGLTAYRVSPWRKWAWEHRVSIGLGWALQENSDTVFGNGFESDGP